MRRAVTIASLLFLASCSYYKVDSELLSSQIYPPKSSLNEVTYLEVLTQPYEIIGSVKVNSERNQRLSDVIEKMKREAAMLGGDAITNIRTNAGEGKWAKIKPQKLFGNAHIRANFLADVIVFKQASE